MKEKSFFSVSDTPKTLYKSRSDQANLDRRSADFRKAINAAFPTPQIQHCIILVDSLCELQGYQKFNIRPKKVYQAIDEDEALSTLLEFKDK